jgi:hypothetical protein
MVQFRTWAASRDNELRSLAITELEAHTEPADVETVLSRPASEMEHAAAEALRLARDLPNRQALLAGALRTTIPKANEVHYYKYLAALVEDVPLVSAEWQSHLTAASLYYMKRPGDPEPEPMMRARKALRMLSA